MKNESLRLSFAINEARQLYIAKATVCSAVPYPSTDLDERAGITGTWVQLEDGNQNVIYRIDLPSVMAATLLESGEGDRTYDVLVPNYPDAQYAAVYSPPAAEDALQPHFGAESVLLLRAPVTADIHGGINTIPDLPSDICGKGRGMVLNKYTAVYNRDNQMVYNFVLLADRFYKSEQDTFVKNAKKCVSLLLSRPPFSTNYGMCSMNIHFVEVETFDKNNPYFSTQIRDGTSVSWDDEAVKEVCDSLFAENGKPYWNWAGIIVNYDKKRIGTAYPNLDQFAVGLWHADQDNDCAMTLQHEFGHAAFNLADEYAKKDSGRYTGAEPNHPNVTKVHTINELKWKKFVTPGASIPTPKKEKGVVGCFEGGFCYETGIYRPQYDCVMKQQSDVDGYYCRVCTHQSAKVVTKSIGMYVPAPGSLSYSGADRHWSPPVVAFKLTSDMKQAKKCDEYDNIIAELRSQRVGSSVRKLFLDEDITLPGQMKVFEIQYLQHDFGYRGLWYIASPGASVMYYINTSKIEQEIKICFGKLLIPAYPELTTFDGARVGMETHLFCCDNGNISYGIQDQGGTFRKEFTAQEVNGLSATASITAISTEYVNSRLMVAVVDAGKIKIAAYELLSESWNKMGAVTMPSDETDEYSTVKTAHTKNNIHVAAGLGNKIQYGLFNSMLMCWEKTDPLTMATPVEYFDLCAGSSNVYLLTQDGISSNLYEYSIITGTWKEPADISNQLGLNAADIVTSWNTAMLGSCIHVTAIVNRGGEKKMMHAAYNIVTRTCEFPFTEIVPLLPIRSDIGGMALHSSDSQLHLILSSMRRVFPLTR